MNRLRRCRRVWIGLALALIAPAVDGTQPCNQWQLVNPLPATSDLLGATHGNGLFVMVGRDGTVLTSPDEVGWRLSEAATTHDLHAVEWTGERYVAVGSMGTILTSEDGFSWAAGQGPTTNDLFDVAVGPNQVAVGEVGTILSSDDGLTWTGRDSGTTADLFGVAWTGTEFLAVGADPGIFASADGATWSLRAIDNFSPFSCIASNGTTTIAVADDGYSWATTDGVQWTRGWAAHGLRDIVWAADRFIAAGGSGYFSARYSADGLAWSYSQSALHGLAVDALASDGHITVTGGTGGAIAVTRDGGAHFKPVNTTTGLDLYGLASNGDNWVAAAGTPSAGTGALLVSDDALNWEIVYEMDLESLYDVASNGSVYLAVGVINELWSGGAMALRSPDGHSWGGAVGSVTGPGGWPWEWRSVTWDGARFVAAGSGGAVAVSPDASSWYLFEAVTDHTYLGVASDTQTLVTVGGTGTIAVSHDGQVLSEIHPGYEDGELSDVAWGNGSFVAVGSLGRILTSANGDQWLEQASGTSTDLRGVYFSGEVFVAVGAEGTVLTSTDGVHWQTGGDAGGGDLFDVVQFGSELTAVGRHGIIMRSACADPDQPPAPRFAWRPTLPEAGVPVHFVDLSTGSPTSWRWEFGDANSANGPSATHVFSEDGIWPVTLTVGNDNGSATAYAPVTVRRFCGAPPATEVSAPPSAASGESFEITWTETLQPHEHGEYVVHESVYPDFEDRDGWGTWIYTSSVVNHEWTEGASFFYRVLSVNYCPDGSYRSPESNTVRVDIEPNAADLGDHVQVITAAAHGSGLKNTSWVSDVVIHNPHQHAAPAYLFLLLRDGEGPPVGSARHWIEPGRSMNLEDALAHLQGPGYGALLMASDRPLLVGSRTFNDQPNGSYGQFIEGVPITRADDGEGETRLIQLTQNDRYRANLAMANPRPDDVEVSVDIFFADGDLLATKSYSLPGLSSLFDTEFLLEVTNDDVDDGYAVVSSETPGASWVALASVVDNASGDPVALPALKQKRRHRVVSLEDVPLISDDEWYDILFAGDVYVASGRRALAWSRDGVHWQAGLTFEFPSSIRHLAWNGSQILAVNRYWVYSSSDGISWTGVPFNGDGYDTVAWDGSRWVGLGGGGATWTEVGFSSDGVNWDQERVDGIRVRNIIWAGDRFVAAGPSGLASSTDALSWQMIETFDSWVSDLAWNGRQLIALGPYEIYASTDFENFASQVINREPSRVVWAGDQWVVAAGPSTTNSVDAFLVSPDATHWTSVPNPGPWLHPAEGITWDGMAVQTVDFRRRLTWLVSDQADALIPAVAHLGGYGGSLWRSDVELHNSAAEPVACTLELVERDVSGLEPEQMEVTVGAASSLRLSDVLATQFGHEGAGALTVRPSGRTVMVSSRTYVDAPEGTYGQLVPGLHTTDAIHVFETGRLIQLRHHPRLDNGFRTNIGLASQCPEEMEITINLHLGSGEFLGSETVILPPMGVSQLNNVFAAFTDDTVADGFAVLFSPTPRCAFHAYASVVDNRTHDPILVPVRPWPQMP